MKKLKFLFAGCVLSLVSVGQQVLPLDPAVRTGVLPNGLTYFIRHNEEPKNRALLYLVNNVGSILEDEDQQGLAHFMEHMSFNGTVHYPKNALIDYLQKNGVRFGADINAYTNFDETVYQLPIPTDKPEVVANGLQIIRDWANSAVLDPAEIDKERGVVLEEKRLGKGAGERLRRLYWPVVVNGSRYAYRQAIGTDSVLSRFVPATIQRFYHDWYRPDLQAVVIVGDINVDQMEKEVKARFADLRNPAQERPRAKYPIALAGSGRFIVATDPEMTATQAEVIIKHRGLVIRTEADYREDLIRNLLNEMLQGRYGELARQANPPFVQAGAGVGGFVGGLDVFDGSVTARPGQLELGFKAMWREMVRAGRFGFTKTELDRAKASVLSGITAALKEKDKTVSAKYVQEYQEFFLKGQAAPGIEVEYALTAKDLPGITLEEVNKYTGGMLEGKDRDILILAAEKERGALPDSGAVAGWMAAVEAGPLEAYKDEVSSGPLLAHAPVAGKVVGEKRDAGLGVTTLKLSNGVTVLLKPTEFKNDQILFSGFASGGSSLYPDADYETAASAAAVVSSGGVGNYDEGALQKFLAGKQVGVSPGIDEQTQGINGSSTPADLETALQLVYAYFTEPRKDSAVFASIIERSRAQLMNRANNPGAVFSDSVSAVLGNYNIRRTGPSLEKLGRIDLDKAFRIYKERFADASGFTFVFVGSFDVVSIRPLLERYLGGLPSTRAGEKGKDLGIHIPAGKIEKVVYKGSEPKATVYMVMSGEFDYSAVSRVRLEALREVLQIRMLERLREEESGVYSPGVSFNSTKGAQPRYSMAVSFGCAPANADKLVASALDEIAKVRRDGPVATNLEKWKAEAKAGRETAVKTNGFWSGYLAGQVRNGADLHEVDGYLRIVDSVTVGDLRDAAKRYLSGGNYVRLELMPEK
ncbi:MAG: insulinase family protein [Bacteroidetes bacterium]|nr:insulinase family protein [Bacteroidota bacterium]